MIDSGLKFHALIKTVVGKTGAMINNLLSSTTCRSSEFMLTLWVTHIRPIIKYGSCVWNIGNLEGLRRLKWLQRKWFRESVGMDGLDYVSRFEKIGLYSIKSRLLRIDLIQIWKSFQCDIDVRLSALFEYSRCTTTGGHAYKLSIPMCRKEVRRQSFAVRLVFLWNSLPPDIVTSTSTDTFEYKLDVFMGDRLFGTAWVCLVTTSASSDTLLLYMQWIMLYCNISIGWNSWYNGCFYALSYQLKLVHLSCLIFTYWYGCLHYCLRITQAHS